jgi:hypothetical protein
MLSFTCVICENFYEGWGNNPEPIKEDGRCCNNCNTTVVIPKRLEDLSSTFTN